MRSDRRLRLATIALAALLAWAAPLAVRAQLVSTSGDVSPPISPAPVVDLSGQRIFLGFTSGGVGTLGSLTVSGGGLLTTAQLVPGVGGLGVGFVLVDGAGSVINLTGGASNNGLDIGSWGTGTVTVSNGGLIACSSTLACPFNSIGNAAGSTGTLAINGGSVTGLGFLGVGQSTLLPTFGTPGANTTGNLTITNGGVLSSNGGSSVASNSSQTGFVTGNVTINGAGSNWTITRDLANGGSQASLSLAPNANGTANVTISNGGNLTVIGSRANPATDSSLPFIGMSGAAGATSTMTVTTGGSVRIGGDSGVINVGGSPGGIGGNASLNITAGGTVSGLGTNGLVFMRVGQNQATGTVNVSGAGSQLVVAGVGGVNTQGLEGVGGLLQVGSNRGNGGGTGTLNVTNGGSVLISDNGQAAVTGLGLQLASGTGSTGTATVSGAGSSIVVSSTGGGTEAPHVLIGQGGSGQMTISGGASVSVQAAGQQRNFIVGNSSSGSGTLNVTTGGQISASRFAVADVAGSSGVATIDASTVNLDGVNFFNGSPFGASVRVGRGTGANGVLNLQNGAVINIDNSIVNASVILGGTNALEAGTGTLNMSGASSINFTGSAASASLQVGGPSGTGFMTMTGNSVVDTGATGAALVGTATGSTGHLTISGGSKIFGNSAGIGGNSDTVAGGNGTVVLSGVGSLLSANGANGFVGVGRSGTGSLSVSDQGSVSAIIVSVGRAAGGVGTMSIDNAVVSLSGQQTAGALSGAGMAIGNLGGTGAVSITNGSQISISNGGTAGAGLYIGGNSLFPLGSGSLSVSNSQISVTAAPPPASIPGQIPATGLARVIVGHDGNGTATLTNSTLQVGNPTILHDGPLNLNGGDGSLIIARQTGSTGVLSLNGGSVVRAGYVGVGVSQPGVIQPDGSVTQANGGAGRLIVNNSTINTTTLEIGAQGILSGSGGVINAAGGVIIGGTLSPGNSPGPINFNCDLRFLTGSKLILDIQADGSGGFNVDHLILGPTATFNFANVQVDFNFIGDTDPTAFLASGRFTLDTFLEFGDLNSFSPLAAATGQAWSDLFSSSQFIATSDTVVFSSFVFTPPGPGGAGGGASFEIAAVPEPSTWLTMAIGLLFLGAFAARRQRRA